MTALSRMMKDQKLSYRTLSEKSGVPYTTLHDVVSGKHKISNIGLKTAKDLADALRILPEELLDLEWNLNGRNVVSDMGIPFCWKEQRNRLFVEFDFDGKRYSMRVLSPCLYESRKYLYDRAAGWMIDDVINDVKYAGNMEAAIKNYQEC